LSDIDPIGEVIQDVRDLKLGVKSLQTVPLDVKGMKADLELLRKSSDEKLQGLNKGIEAVNESLNLTTRFAISPSTNAKADAILSSRDIEISDAGWLSVGVAVDTAAILKVRFLKGGTFFPLNNNVALKASTLYSFSFEVEPGDFVNFNVDTDLKVSRFIVRYQKRLST